MFSRWHGADCPRIKPQGYVVTAQMAAEWRREIVAARGRIEQVAKVLGADAEEMEREATMLAVSTMMDRATAIYYVAKRRLNAAKEERGGIYG